MSYHCTRLIVESRNPHTGFWEKVAVLNPEYVYEEEIVPWLWFWTKKIRDIANQWAAYVAARKEAIKKAKILRGECRVTEYWAGGAFGPESEIIWKDGKFLDH
jgi:hypothetical protein